jgi:Na+/H+-dicarboxylate symporter
LFTSNRILPFVKPYKTLILWVLAQALVFKVPCSGEDHGEAQFIAGFDGFLVPDGAAGLNDGFDASGTALMLTIFALQDSFGTACNVTGDGALPMILTGYVEKHKMEEQKIDLAL